MSRLITIPVSHFCEKARWALDLSGTPYVEDAWPPALHRLPLMRHRTTTAPVLVLDDGRVLKDSAAIVRHAGVAGGAEVDALVARYDERLGPATRLLVYSHLLDDRDAFVRAAGVGLGGGREKAFLRMAPALMALMRRHFGTGSTDRVARARATVEEELAAADEQRGGSKYLVGDAFTAADLTFAALAAPVVFPDGYGRVPLPPLEEAPAGLRDEVERFRATPSGAAVQQLYAEHRRP